MGNEKTLKDKFYISTIYDGDFEQEDTSYTLDQTVERVRELLEKQGVLDVRISNISVYGGPDL